MDCKKYPVIIPSWLYGYFTVIIQVLNTLSVLRADLEKKESDKRNYIEKSEMARIRISEQEAEIAELQSAAEEMRKQERLETARIEALRTEIRQLDQETFDLDNERTSLEETTKVRHEQCQIKESELKSLHKELVGELEVLTRERDEIRLNNEDARKRHKISQKTKAKLEKEIERLTKQNESSKGEFELLQRKVRQLTNQNNELLQVIERKERQAQAQEDNLASMIDTTKAQIEDQIRVRKEHETRLAADEKELQSQSELLAETKTKMNAYIQELRETIEQLKGRLVEVKGQTLTVQAELDIVETKLAERTAQNHEEVEKLSAELSKLNEENAIKERRKNALQTQLDNLISHEKELIQRTKDLKAQQIVLTEKREAVLEAIEGHKETLKIVENDHRVQIEANAVMKKRLEEAKAHALKRKTHFESMIAEREMVRKTANFHWIEIVGLFINVLTQCFKTIFYVSFEQVFKQLFKNTDSWSIIWLCRFILCSIRFIGTEVLSINMKFLDKHN